MPGPVLRRWFNMTKEYKSDWKIILGVIVFAIFYVYVQYRLTEIIETIPK